MNGYSREFFELSNDLLCVASFDGKFIQVNKTWVTTFGWSLEELTNVDFIQFVHPEDRAATALETASLAKGNHTVSFENRYLTKSGEYLTVQWKSSSDLEQGLIFGVARDITELRRKEKLLLEDNARFQQILNTIEDFILIKDRDCRLIYANKGFRNFYGFKPDEDILGLTDKTNNDPELTEKYLQDDRFVVETAQRLVIPWEYSTRFDGVRRKLRVVKSPIFDERGKVIMTMGVSKDITDDLEKEALIQEQQLKMIASSRLSSLGEMAAGIAHEVNNPLQIADAIMYQASLQIEKNKLEIRDLKEIFERMAKALDRIARIVRSLRFFSRNAALDPFVSADIGAIFRDTAELCREKFKLANVKLEIAEIPDLKVLCRPGEIGQVLLNLLNNSFDAVQGTTDAWVIVSSKLQGDRLVISVTDSGKGIPPEVQDSMMTPFFTTKEVGKGTGLGLSIAMGIVKSHGGEISYSNQMGHTTFKFDLQAVEPSETH